MPPIAQKHVSQMNKKNKVKIKVFSRRNDVIPAMNYFKSIWWLFCNMNAIDEVAVGNPSVIEGQMFNILSELDFKRVAQRVCWKIPSIFSSCKMWKVVNCIGHVLCWHATRIGHCPNFIVVIKLVLEVFEHQQLSINQKLLLIHIEMLLKKLVTLKCQTFPRKGFALSTAREKDNLQVNFGRKN